jgi:hypothetical protein
MKYSVSINEKKQTITVTLADGTQGVAKCCPTDKFDIGTGIELALDRAKRAQASRAKPAPAPAPAAMSVMELVKALEAALPKGGIIVVGNGDELTEANKYFLASLIGVDLDAECDCADCAECDCEECSECEAVREVAYNEGYEDGYADGYASAKHAVIEALAEM